MENEKALSGEVKIALDKWAEEVLAGIGIFRNNSQEYQQLAAQAIGQLRSIYSDRAIDIFLRTKDNRKIEAPDAFARVTGSCGETMEIYLKIENGLITDSSFQTDGCQPSIASGGIVAEMIRGKFIDKIKKYTPKDVLDSLGGLPKENEHCASLAIHTLKEAIEDYYEKTKGKS